MICLGYKLTQRFHRNEKLHDHCWHLDHVPGTRMKITVCCACKALKVSETSKADKSESQF